MFLNIAWSGLEPKGLIITAVGTKASCLYIFASLAVMCKFSQTLVEIIYELKLNRDSLCSLQTAVN